MQPATKLRASCDNCLVAKVRCSRNPDGCARCVDYGATCSYSPSLRGARSRVQASQRAMNNAASTSTAEKPQSSPSNPQSSSNDRDQGQDESEQRIVPTPQFTSEFTYEVAPTFDNVHVQSGFPDFTEAMDTDSIEFNDIEDTQLDDDQWSTTHLLKSPVENTPFPLPAGPPNQDNPTMFTSNYRGSTASSVSGDLFSAISTTNTTSTSSNRPSDDEMTSPTLGQRTLPSHNRQLTDCLFSSNLNPCECFNDILETLSALQRYCKTPAAPLHVALTVNKKARDRCRTILGCPCTQEDNCLTLLSVVISRILFLYRLAAKGYFASSPQMSSAVCKRPQPLSLSTQSAGTTNSSPPTPTGPARVTFGTYSVDGEDERRVSKEIVMIAVTKVDHLIKALADLIQTMQQHPSISLYRTLSEHLFKEFGSTVESIRSWR